MNTQESCRVLAVIPARYASMRLPGKMIMELAGKPVVLHAYERTCEASLVDKVIVAADDSRIVDALAAYQAPVQMTSPDHVCGTDRIAEVALGVDAEIILNVQGDEVNIEPETIDNVIRPLLDQADVVMSTARHRITEPEIINNPNVVKVVCDVNGHALYFSRSPIPHIRDQIDRDSELNTSYWQHVGIYAFRRDFLIEFSGMSQTPLENLEKLEQLRAIENGYKIAVVETVHESIGIDTPEDLERARAILEK